MGFLRSFFVSEKLSCQHLNPLKHGHTKKNSVSPTYESWRGMKARCRYPTIDKRNRYIGRGISVCERWNVFENFLEDMGERPVGKTIDRINSDDGYYLGNCRWATKAEQERNRCNSKLNYDAALDIAQRMLKGEKAKDVASLHDISESMARHINKGRSWKDAYDAARR